MGKDFPLAISEERIHVTALNRFSRFIELRLNGAQPLIAAQPGNQIDAAVCAILFSVLLGPVFVGPDLPITVPLLGVLPEEDSPQVFEIPTLLAQ